MPTVFQQAGYRVYFYSHEPNEPMHVHIDKDHASAKFWVNPIQLACNLGYSPRELNEIRLLVLQRQQEIMEAWYGHFGSASR